MILEPAREREPSICQTPPGKKRRLMRKETPIGFQPVDATPYNPSDKILYKENEVTYIRNHPWRTRRYTHTPCAIQNAPQLLQVALVPQTLDIDIECCMFTLIGQMIDRLEIVDERKWRA